MAKGKMHGSQAGQRDTQQNTSVIGMLTVTVVRVTVSLAHRPNATRNKFKSLAMTQLTGVRKNNANH